MLEYDSATWTGRRFTDTEFYELPFGLGFLTIGYLGIFHARGIQLYLFRLPKSEWRVGYMKYRYYFTWCFGGHP